MDIEEVNERIKDIQFFLNTTPNIPSDEKESIMNTLTFLLDTRALLILAMGKDKAEEN